MIQGLNEFKKYFEPYNDKYVIIGGVAAYILMEESGVSFRATKDFDMVLCLEAVNKEFVEEFWNFIRKAGYKIIYRNDKPIFYRFINPTDNNYPKMIELFSADPKIDLKNPDDIKIKRIKKDEAVFSLSAIIMENESYKLIIDETIEVDGVRIIDSNILILLKIIAYFDLLKRKIEGRKIDSRDIKKHKNDVYRISQILIPGKQTVLSEDKKEIIRRFIKDIPKDNQVIKDLKISIDENDIVKILKTVFRL